MKLNADVEEGVRVCMCVLIFFFYGSLFTRCTSRGRRTNRETNGRIENEWKWPNEHVFRKDIISRRLSRPVTNGKSAIAQVVTSSVVC